MLVLTLSRDDGVHWQLVYTYEAVTLTGVRKKTIVKTSAVRWGWGTHVYIIIIIIITSIIVINSENITTKVSRRPDENDIFLVTALREHINVNAMFGALCATHRF